MICVVSGWSSGVHNKDELSAMERPTRLLQVLRWPGTGQPALAIGAAFGLLLVAALAIGAAISDPSDPKAIPPADVSSPRVVILKSQRVLHLFDGDRLVRSYPVDLGVNSVGLKRRKNDGRTPEGSFQVASKNSQSEYRCFIGIDYPDLSTAHWGLAKGLISQGEMVSIERAHRTGRCPEWSTALGGGIGIHGHRKGTNWTGGCIAVSDEAVEELFNVLRIGDRVEILP